MSKWNAFHARHGERKFTPVFNDYLEAIMQDPERETAERVDAWIMRRSWGNHSDSCVDANGIIQTGSDCGRDLGISKQRVSEVLRQRQKTSYIRLEGREIIPVNDPFAFSSQERYVRTSDEEEANTASSSTGSLTFSVYMQEVFAREYPHDFKEYQRYEAKIREVKMRALNLYRQVQRLSEMSGQSDVEASDGCGQNVTECTDNAAEMSGQSPAASYITKQKLIKGTKAASASFEEGPAAVAPQTPPPPLLKALKPFLKDEPQLPAQLLKACQRFAPKASPDEIAHFVYLKTERANQAKNPVGFLLSVIPAFFANGYREHLPTELLTAPPAARKGPTRTEELQRWSEEGDTPDAYAAD